MLIEDLASRTFARDARVRAERGFDDLPDSRWNRTRADAGLTTTTTAAGALRGMRTGRNHQRRKDDPHRSDSHVARLQIADECDVNS
jgi:hypothetical protein